MHKEFSMDPGLLVSVMKSQAGSLAKALLEAVMNSIDAGSKDVEISLEQTRFTVRDSGRGFCTEAEIESWFGRFGTPHVEGDAQFGRFRMGRGQLFAFAKNTWKTGSFQMFVDIESAGLGYQLTRLDAPQKGCLIEGELYKALEAHELLEVCAEFERFVEFAPRPVYLNGKLVGGPARRLTSWTFEDEFAYYKVSGASELKIYNQGIYVEERSIWQMGMGGVVVSKLPLKVNFARNAVLVRECSTWNHIKGVMERLVLTRLASSSKLQDDQRRYLGRRLSTLRLQSPELWRDAKLLTDPSGRHFPLSHLKAYKSFVFATESTAAACAAHGRDGLFVVTDTLLDRFGVYSLDALLDKFRDDCPSLIHPDARVVDASVLSAFSPGAAKAVGREDLCKQEMAALSVLEKINEHVCKAMREQYPAVEQRAMRVGSHKVANFEAWTDGKSYITVNRRYLKRFKEGLPGCHHWVMVLIHEYCHDTDDSESHSHGEVFFQKFHDIVVEESAALAALPTQALGWYLQMLREQGLSRPAELRNQLKGPSGVASSAQAELFNS